MDCNVLLTKYWVMSLVIICSTNYILLITYLLKKKSGMGGGLPRVDTLRVPK